MALQAIASEDPSFRVNTDRDTGQTIVSGMGECHLDRIVARLQREVGGDLQVGDVQVVYCETVRVAAEGEHKFARRVRGRDHYAHVVIRIEPLKNRHIFELVSAVHDADVPNEFVASIEQGISEGAQTGIVAGFRVLGVKVTVIGGSHRPGESSKLDFKIAASSAFKEVARRAQPFLLEPVIAVEVVVPEEFLGDIIGDLSARYGMIQGLDAIDQAHTVRAHVRLARMLRYSADLRSMTQGRGTYTEAFLSWAEVDPGADPDGNEPVSAAMRAA
jgi:elongation factor G